MPRSSQRWRTSLVPALLTSLLFGASCSSPAETQPKTSAPEMSRQDMASQDMGHQSADLGAEEMGSPPDMQPGEKDQGADMPASSAATIRGRFESAGPIRQCGGVATWRAPDGFLLRPVMNTCGDDMQALANTIIASLDAAAARDAKVMLVIGQGINLPQSWLSDCVTFNLESGRFSGTTCVPWDAAYQAKLRAALVDTIGPAVRGHEALAGVYFSITTMTNGAELHLRINRDAIQGYPGDEVMRQAYLDVMDIYQEAFDVPVVFEGGHCLWMDEEDCQTPLSLYTHARDKHGVANTGVAMWNCAERFFVSESSPEFGARALFELASEDGASVGCQTVGAFGQACRFTSAETASYGTAPSGPGSSDCADSTPEDVERACVDTMRWFTGAERVNVASPVIRGTWSEIWSQDVAAGGVYESSEACRQAVDLLKP